MAYRTGQLNRSDLDAMYAEVAAYVRLKTSVSIPEIAQRFNLLVHEAWAIAFALRGLGAVRFDGRLRKFSILVAP